MGKSPCRKVRLKLKCTLSSQRYTLIFLIFDLFFLSLLFQPPRLRTLHIFVGIAQLTDVTLPCCCIHLYIQSVNEELFRHPSKLLGSEHQMGSIAAHTSTITKDVHLRRTRDDIRIVLQSPFAGRAVCFAAMRA